jgi:hypothetical protein
MVTRTKGIATHITHINGTIIKSVPRRVKCFNEKHSKYCNK